MKPDQHPLFLQRAAAIADGLVRHQIPRHMHEGVAAYILGGREPGGFLTSALAGDGFQAIRQADLDNQEALGRWFAFLLTSTPSAAIGSYEAVSAWVRGRGLRGVIEAALAATEGMA